MTFSVGNIRDAFNFGNSDKNADVLVTYGPITITVVESVPSLRAFWSQLGRVLDDAEKSN